jgi:RNA polymerase sigma factor (sigma-70 family)
VSGKEIKHQIHEAVQGALAGDPAATPRLCKLLEPLLLSFAMSIVQEADAEDAVQDSLIALIGNLAKRSDFEGDFMAYSKVVTRNRCIEILQRRKKGLEDLDPFIEDRSPGSFTDALIDLISEEREAILSVAMAKLDAGCRELLEKIFYHEIPIKKLVDGVRAKSVQVIYYRRRICLGKLIKIFKKLGGGASYE